MQSIYDYAGKIIFHDLDYSVAKHIQTIVPEFKIEFVLPKQGYIPKYQILNNRKVYTDEHLMEMDCNQILSLIGKSTKEGMKDKGKYSYSVMEALYFACLNSISDCRLCGWQCGVNRFVQTGRCGFGHKISCGDSFVHAVEEPVINPSIVTNIAGGCALCCQYCIDHELWDNTGNLTFSEMTPERYWQRANDHKKVDVPINTIEFTNATETLHSVIAVLSKAPAKDNYPVVLNIHLYGTKLFYTLAAMVTDVWLVDLRYGSNDCARKLSMVDDYMKYAEIGLESICSMDSRVIVRILILPGHITCCHEPALRLLSKYKDKIWLSILDQYVPEHKAYLFDDLNRRPSDKEIMSVRKMANDLGLRDVSINPDSFWK